MREIYFRMRRIPVGANVQKKSLSVTKSKADLNRCTDKKWKQGKKIKGKDKNREEKRREENRREENRRGGRKDGER